MRATQQYDLYDAEHRVESYGRTFASLDEIQAYLDGLVDSWWWQEFYSMVRTIEVGKVTRRKGEGSVGAWFPEDRMGIVEMHRVHWNENMVLHEIAHVLADARFASKAHCPWFAKVYTDLVYHVRGAEAWADLHRCLTEGGIEIATVKPAGIPVLA